MSRIKRRKQSRKKISKSKSLAFKKKMWTLIIGGLMVASVFGIMFSGYNSKNEEYQYGDFEIQRTDNRFQVEVNDQEYLFYYHPADLDDIEVSQSVIDKLRSSKIIYVTIDPTSKDIENVELARYEITQKLRQGFETISMPGILSQDETYNQPIITCQNSTQVLPVISMQEGNNTMVRMNGSCIELIAREGMNTALQDRIMYGILGIIE